MNPQNNHLYWSYIHNKVEIIFPIYKIILRISIVLFIAEHHLVHAKEIRNSRHEIISLDPNVSPSKNFDLSDWSLSLPIDTNKDGIADNVPEHYLKKGLSLKPVFYTAEDGGMVFYTPIDGPKTSKNTMYTRTELREMLRADNSRIKNQGITKDESIRLYYRKLPNNTHSSIYMAHEPLKGDEPWYDIIGSRASNAKDMSDGIALDEVFSYRIKVVGNLLTVTNLSSG